jgi:hypothetical protein
VNEFYYGDRVVLVVDHPLGEQRLRIGMTGMVCDIDDSDDGQPGIWWDDEMGGHTCCETCPDGHGWYTASEWLELEYGCDDTVIVPVSDNDMSALLS